MRFLPCGTAGLMVELDSIDQVRLLYALAGTRRPPGVIDIVPAARTITFALDPSRLTPTQLREHLEQLADAPAPTTSAGEQSALIDIPVTYVGADLDQVAALLNCSREQLIARHTQTRWQVAFCGFAPGFAYLIADDDQWRVPRRDSPRAAVPAGAVALADEYSAVYPRESPGGWQLIGHTAMPMFDLTRDPPAVLTPGTRVRFVSLDQ